MNEHAMNRVLGIYGDAAQAKFFGVSTQKMESIMAAQRETLAKWKVSSPPRPEIRTITSRPVAQSVSGSDRARDLGEKLGRKYGGDVRALAYDLGVELQYVEPQRLSLMARTDHWLAGWFNPDDRTAYVANDGGGFSVWWVAAHELGHAMGIGWHNDAEADLFAESFFAVGEGR